MDETDNTRALNSEEEELLAKNMEFYRALETGQREPNTKAQEHFVRVTRGQATAASIHEIAYAKHMRLRAEQRAANQNENPHDPSDGPTAEWFSREDWYKLRGRRSGNPGDE